MIRDIIVTELRTVWPQRVIFGKRHSIQAASIHPARKKEQNRLEKRSKISLTKGGRSDNIAKLSAGAGQKSGIDTET